MIAVYHVRVWAKTPRPLYQAEAVIVYRGNSSPSPMRYYADVGPIFETKEEAFQCAKMLLEKIPGLTGMSVETVVLT